MTINASQTTGTATFQLNPTDDDLDEDDESVTIDGSVAGLSRDGGDSDDQRRRHGRGDSQPDEVVGG